MKQSGLSRSSRGLGPHKPSTAVRPDQLIRIADHERRTPYIEAEEDASTEGWQHVRPGPGPLMGNVLVAAAGRARSPGMIPQDPRRWP